MDEANRFSAELAKLGATNEEAPQFYQEGAQAWPNVALDGERFARFVHARLADSTLAELRADELYLVCACASHDNRALRHFEQSYMPAARAALDRDLAAYRDEVAQRLRQKFFVGDGQKPPKIESYRGDGSLKGWVRACAVREALNLLRSDRREVPLEEAHLDAVVAPALSAQTAQLKAGYQREFKIAFAHALSALSPRDRVLLRYKFIDGATIDEIGGIYNVHRTTAARWLREIRAQLFHMTKAHLIGALGLEDSDFDSILRWVQSQLDASISEALKG